VLLAPQRLNDSRIVVDQLLRQPRLVLYLLAFIVLFQLAFLELVAPFGDPVDKAPHRLENDAVKDLRVDYLAQPRLLHQVQLQVHPDEGRIGLKKGFDLVQ
jgi:hypothetical protein